MHHNRKPWIWYTLATLAVVIGFPLFPEPYADPGLLTGAIGAIWALAFFQNSRAAEDARFLKELMGSFNKRYDDMNEVLQSACKRQGPFNQDEELKVIDYFNLCAEEWLYWKQGYIIAPVWRAWWNGMRQYARDPRVRELWQSERGTESYYGFEFPTE